MGEAGVAVVAVAASDEAEVEPFSEDIPYEARIIAVCDAIETMTGKSSYKVPMTAEEAARELLDCSGSQFDSEVVKAFLRVLERPMVKKGVADGA